MRSVQSKHVLVVVTRPAVDPNPEGQGAAQRPPPRGEKGKPPNRRTPEGNPSRKAGEGGDQGDPDPGGRGRQQATPTTPGRGAPGDPNPTQGGKGGATQGRGATKVRMPVRQAKPQPTIDIELALDHQHAPSAIKPTLGIKLKTILHVVMEPSKPKTESSLSG